MDTRWVMPDIPTFVPLLLTGILFGSILRTTKVHISWRFMVSGSLLGGLGNVVHAAALYLFQGQQTRQAIPSTFASSQIMPTQTPIYFLVLSFIIGAFMILLVLIAASLTIRIRGRKVLEE